MATSVLEPNITTSTIALQFEQPQRTQRAERIVVVEHDRVLQEILQRLFSSQGFQVIVLEDAGACVDFLQQQTPSALVLDLERLGSSKSNLCKEISRTIPHLPLVILGTSSDVTEKVLLLELGADYVTIPFSPRELAARVRGLIRRTRHSNSEVLYAFEDVKVDCSGMEVTRHGHAVQLTTKEFQTLQYLLKNANRVVSREELLNKVWGYYSYPCTRTVDNHILKLRQKLEDTPSRPSHFLTTHGVGYKFVP